MASNYWIKMYQEVLDDPKMGRLPDNLWRRFFECCLLAGELQQEGRLPPVHDIAWRLRVEEETLRGEFDQMARMGLLDYIARPLDEHWIVVKFAERQSPMSGAERVQRHRNSQKKREYYEVRNETVTNRYTDTDTDTDKEEDTDTAVASVIKHYRNNIGEITPTMKDKLELAVEDFSVDWIIEAIDISVTQNKRSWAYALAILRRWKSDGKDSGKKKQAEMTTKDKLRAAGYDG